MFGRAIKDKFPLCIFENSEISKFSGSFMPKITRPNMWLLVNHTNHFVLKLISFDSMQSWFSGRAITITMLITMNRVTI